MFSLISVAAVLAVAAPSLPDSLQAGWQDQPVCELLHEDSQQRYMRCTFPPGVGHERHYHLPYFGYAVSGGRVLLTDTDGAEEIDLPTGSSFASPAVEWHEMVNVGDTTIVYLIVESRTATDVQTEGDAVLALEDSWVDAESSRDEAALRRILDDQFTYNSNNGETSGKEAMIASVLGATMTGQTITERTVSVIGDTATVFGTTVIRYDTPDGEVAGSPLRYTTVYVKRDGRWRAIALQMTERTED